VKRSSWRKIFVWSGSALGAVLLLVFIGGVWVGTSTANLSIPRPGRGPLPLLDEAWNLVAEEYYGALPPASVRFRGAIRGLLETLGDPYTVLLDPAPAQQERQRLSGRYGSVGVSLWWAETGVIALTPHENGPAACAGVQTGDRLLAIDGERLQASETLEAVAARLEGEVGSAVTLTLQREGTSDEITLILTREETVQPSTEWRRVEGTDDVGYLRIQLFTTQTPDEVPQAVRELLQKGAHALVLDLRGNGGGMLADLDAIAGVFLPAGATVYYEVTETEEHEVQARGDPLFTGPLVVLVDGGTASTAEILAAALRDHGRAILIGAQTYGKSSIQALYPLPDGSVLHVTHAVWLTPARARLDGVGLLPDVPAEPHASADAALEAALAYFYARE